MSNPEKLERALLQALDPSFSYPADIPLPALRTHVTSALRLKGEKHAEGIVGLCRVAHADRKVCADALRAGGYDAVAAQLAQPAHAHVFGGVCFG